MRSQARPRYEPVAFDDPDTECWPVAELKDAEQVFNDHIMKYEPKDGEQRQLTIIGDYGSEINKGNLWLRNAGERPA